MTLSTLPLIARSIPISLAKLSIKLLLFGVLSPRKNLSKGLASAITHHYRTQ